MYSRPLTSSITQNDKFINITHKILKRSTCWEMPRHRTWKKNCKSFQHTFMSIYSMESSIEDMWGVVQSTLPQLQERFWASKTLSFCLNQPCFIARVRTMLKRSSKEAKKPRIEKDFKRYQCLKKKCRSECKLAFNNYLADIINQPWIKDLYPKRFWSWIMKGMRCDPSGVAPLKSKDE